MIVGAGVAGLTLAGLLRRQDKTPVHHRPARLTKMERVAGPLVKQLTEPL